MQCQQSSHAQAESHFVTFSSAERSVGKPVFDAAHDLDLVFGCVISVIHGRQWAGDIPALNVVPIGAAVYLR
jgi:hypothetical protein